MPGLRAAAALALVLAGCSDPPPMRPPPPARPMILELEAPDPVVDGSIVSIRGSDLDRAGDMPLLEVGFPDGDETVALGAASELDRGLLEFAVTMELVDLLGEGDHEVDVVISGDGVRSPPLSARLSVATTLDLTVFEVPSGRYHRNDVFIFEGDGFLAEGEGIVEARFVGDFTPEAGGLRPVEARIPVVPAERFARNRGAVLLTTAIGGVEPGEFTGTVEVVSTMRDGYTSRTLPVSTTLEFLPPELYSADPNDVALEQIITVRGAGFLGGPDAPDEVTLIRLVGELTPEDGAPAPFGPAELVLRFVSGSEMHGVLEAESRGGRLVAAAIGVPRATFRGTATPVVIKGTTEVAGAPVPFELNVIGVRQIVQLRFLPSFYDSLTLFGLGAAAGDIEPLVQERIQEIYRAWNLEVRLGPVTDFSENGYATIEIAGTDPNGVGLFGYDNSPGKDVGNLRLYDAIGGTNAETQEDGYPGYGGVFVESFLYFSFHPGLPPNPMGGPDPDEMFDELFDPVRRDPATLAEVRGEGDPDRADQVYAALQALASLIGETAAHELGHSLGLAEPYGSPTVFHERFPDEGCLMDAGNDRPFGERAAQPGYTESRHCNDGPIYLDEILSD